MRVMSLTDETKKMSKSDLSSCLFLSDSPDTVQKKLLKAKTDSIDGITYDKFKRSSLANLINIYSCLKGQNVDQLVMSASQLRHRQFKDEISSFVADYFKDFRYNYENTSIEYCKEVLRNSRANAHVTASQTLADVMNKIGFIY